MTFDMTKTVFADMEVGPNLTKRQRKEETDMNEEMVNRNKEINEDDRAKNLVWMVVGRKGEKRPGKNFEDR